MFVCVYRKYPKIMVTSNCRNDITTPPTNAIHNNQRNRNIKKVFFLIIKKRIKETPTASSPECNVRKSAHVNI